MNRRILLIDESAMLRRIVASILQAQPVAYEVVTATRAVEGFAMACTGGIDLLLMDCKVADAGLEICRRLQNDPRTAKLPVVLLVGRGTDHTRHCLFPDNVVGTLIKPFAPEEIVGLVHAIFNFQRAGMPLTELRDSLRVPTATLTDGLADQTSAPQLGERDDRPVLPDEARAFTRQPETPVWHGRDFALSGETNLTSLRAVMHAAADTGLTGILRFHTGRAVHTEVLFDEGRLTVISTRDVQSYAVGALAVVPPKVSEATLDDAMAEQVESGTPFLLTLGTRGLLSKASATGLLDQFGQRQFAKLWTYRNRPSLRYDFEPVEALPSYALRLAPIQAGLDEWLLQSTRHLRPEEVAPLARHEGTVGTPLHQPDGEKLARVLPLAEEERALLRLVHPRRDLPAIARELKIDQEAAYVILHRLRCMEILQYRTAPAAFVVTPRTFSHRILPLKR